MVHVRSFTLLRVLQLSQVKDKEDYGSFEGYEDGAGMYVQYAVANQQGVAKAPPHTSSASNIADLDIVMGSQVGWPMFSLGRRLVRLGFRVAS